MALSITDITTTTMFVNWTSHGTNVAHYNIEIFYGPTEWGDPVVGKQVYGIAPSNRRYGYNGLDPGRQYFVKFYSKDAAQNVIRIETTTFYTLSQGPSAASLNLSVSGRTIYISGTAGANTDIIDLYRDGSYWTYFNMRLSSTYSTTYTGNWGETYTFRVVPENANGVAGPATQKSIRIPDAPLPDPPPAPSGFNIYDQGETWAAFAWNAIASADKYAMEIFQGGVRKDYDYNILGRTKTFTGLSPGVQYLAKLYGYNAGGNGMPVSFYFTLGYSRPANFSWTITKARGRSYRLENGRFVNLVSYDEFVAFRQRINDFRRYKGWSSYTFTNVARGAVLSSTLYNQLNNSINSMAPPTRVPGERSSGASDVAGLLNGVRDSLNSIK